MAAVDRNEEGLVAGIKNAAEKLPQAEKPHPYLESRVPDGVWRVKEFLVNELASEFALIRHLRWRTKVRA